MKSHLCLWIRGHNSLKWQYTQVVLQIQHNPYKISSDFFSEIDNKFTRAITILKNKNKIEGFKLLYLKKNLLQSYSIQESVVLP